MRSFLDAVFLLRHRASTEIPKKAMRSLCGAFVICREDLSKENTEEMTLAIVDDLTRLPDFTKILMGKPDQQVHIAIQHAAMAALRPEGVDTGDQTTANSWQSRQLHALHTHCEALLDGIDVHAPHQAGAAAVFGQQSERGHKTTDGLSQVWKENKK